jgi:DNA modification methylase
MPEPKHPVYVDYVRLSKLQRAHRNPKAHDLGLIDRSMGRFGYVEPIAINEKTGRLVAGHGRLDALERRKAAGAEAPERILVDGDGEWCVPVLRGIRFESDADAEAYLLASNQITIAGGWLDDELAKVLGELAEQTSGLEGVGFEQEDIDELLSRIDADGGPLAEDDPDRLLAHARELQERWQTAERQLWVAGPHRIYCGNSETAPSAFFGERKIRLISCDPPWGIDYAAKARALNKYKRTQSTIERDIANDNLDGPRLRKLFATALKLAAAHAEPGCGLYAMVPSGDRLPFFIAAIGDAGFSYKHALVWVKNSLVMGRADYHYRHELILYAWIENGAHCWVGGRDKNSVFEIDRPTKSEKHPTTKPTELIGRLIRNSSRPGEVIYDPFAGSGTALVAGHQLKRSVYAVELDPLYVAVALQRLADLGLKPELINQETAGEIGASQEAV